MSNAVGETAQYEKRGPKAFRDEEGGVVTEGRNFYTGKGKSGKADDAYFMRPSYVSTGDPFKQGALMSLGRATEKDGHIKAGHEKAFFPAKNVTHEKKTTGA